jgi:hypothetical protein
MSIGNSRIEYINSLQVSGGGSDTDFTWTMNIAPNEEYDRVCVLFANIPISYYLVTNSDNIFELTELGVMRQITVPVGNYNTTSFMAVVVPLMNAASASMGNNWIYTMTMKSTFTSGIDGKFYYSVSGNGGNQPTIACGTLISEQLGFPINTANTFVGDSLVSTNVVNFVPETTIYVYSDLIETKNNNTSNVLQEFYGNNSTSFSNIVYECMNVEAYSKPIRKGFKNSFTIKLINEHGQALDTNGQPIFMTILFYKNNDLYDMFKKFIKLQLLNQN